MRTYNKDSYSHLPDHQSAVHKLERQAAIRHALIHLLAMRPFSASSCASKCRTTEDEILPELEKIAVSSQQNDQVRWQLRDKFFKDLDVWGFRYKEQKNRDDAIDAAIRAYDRLRIPGEDDIWQMLLPEKERNKGKILSRLRLDPNRVSTPSLKPKPFDRKTGLPKKTETKKATDPAKKGKEAVVKKSDKETGAEKDLLAKKVDRKPKQSTGANQTPLGKPAAEKSKSSSSDSEPLQQVKSTQKAVNTKAPRPKPSAEPSPRVAPVRKEIKEAKKEVKKDIKTDVRKDVRKEVKKESKKPSAAAKSLLNKPKNPSPLGGSPPVNASDFEDNHPVHKTLSAAISPTKLPEKSLKRRIDQVNGDGGKQLPRKKMHTEDPSTPKMKPTSSSATTTSGTQPSSSKLKRKAEDDSHATNITKISNKLRKVVNGTSATAKPADSGHRSVLHSSSSSASKPSPNGMNGIRRIPQKDSRSPPTASSPSDDGFLMSQRQIVDMAKKFKRYWAEYEVKYREVQEGDKSKLETVLEMHGRLKDMKAQLYDFAAELGQL
jgi:RNA polymerase II elongation factor ELL